MRQAKKNGRGRISLCRQVECLEKAEKSNHGLERSLKTKRFPKKSMEQLVKRRWKRLSKMQ